VGAMRCLAVCLAAGALVVGGCGYGPEEPRARARDSQVTRGPAGPDQPKPPATRPKPPREKPQSQPKPPGPETVPIDVIYTPPEPGIIYGYIGGALGAVRRVQVMTELKSVNDWLKMYEMENRRFPKDMQELMKLYKRDGGAFHTPPPHYKHFYWPSHGVVKMVRDTDERFRDPQGIHTIKERE